MVFKYLPNLKLDEIVNNLTFFMATRCFVYLSVAEKTMPNAPIPIMLWILYLASISVLLSDIRNLMRFLFPGWFPYPYFKREFIFQFLWLILYFLKIDLKWNFNQFYFIKLKSLSSWVALDVHLLCVVFLRLSIKFQSQNTSVSFVKNIKTYDRAYRLNNLLNKWEIHAG